MGCFEEVSQEGPQTNQHNDERSICLHAFSDLSHVPPATFIYLLKDCYAYGTNKATSKFKILLQLVKAALHNGPQPGPFTYAVQCMYIVPLLGKTYSEGFSHMLTSSLKHLKSVESVKKDFLEAKHLAAQLILDILDSVVPHENRILVKLLETFEIELRDMAYALYGSELDDDLVKAREHLRQYVKCFMESESNAIAVALITRFSIKCCDESFLIKLIESNQLDIAEECATFMGKEMISLVIQKYLDMQMLKSANKLVKEHDLTEEFPDVSYLYKESLVKKLAEKGCWDIAEIRAKKETKLMEYLVYLAMEAGYMEKVDELCQRYSLEGYFHSLVPEKVFCGSDYLDLKKLDVEEIVWVDETNGLLNATSCIEGFKIIGMDCEWRPNFEKNSKPSKVSIIQIASDKIAFIFDLIKLYEDNPKVLDSCFRRIMCSSNILKLGYDIQCDLHQLTQSYGQLECFQSYERLLDMQKLFKWVTGGLSGLSKEILGLGLNKTRRNSNWEQRPLSQKQKEYAALDAVVLVHIFHEHIRRQPQFGVSEGCKAEWKSHVVSVVNSARRPLRF
ncbi:hypothetical protein SEVIR_3G282600v4 [Setaria viridis]|uniref:3'-5' exonuclease domain-containing protein n=1 Tax=Setaria viridis TaxID=4556 RepID=A0A4U6VGB5_SETVI|nr:exonuclease mut-7 homolog isoform X1 [Setaria viridis]XP_034586917.1 exonuclease mut-7 homolog isoform X1 [Setaria viridis]TKW27820.1 hypothetical protein SEVIR_3G282600v2 [Setaria viridis]TKW27822.1 hypothetical protein SEVIR_3G282600v2 [Setaria viridis]